MDTRMTDRGPAAGVVAVSALAVALAGVGLNAALADAREDRRLCWEYYSLCTAGAFDEESWRTVCYSDYTACMGDPEPMTCTDEDTDYCEITRNRCQNRFSGLAQMEENCATDHQVCLDTHEC